MLNASFYSLSSRIECSALKIFPCTDKSGEYIILPVSLLWVWPLAQSGDLSQDLHYLESSNLNFHFFLVRYRVWEGLDKGSGVHDISFSVARRAI